MSIVLLVMTDGRDELLASTLASAETRLRGVINRKVIHTDAGMTHKVDLVERYPDYQIIGGERLGFGGAIARAWDYVGEGPERFVFALEDDFTFNRNVFLHDMAEILGRFSHIAQMALRRQAWNEAELAAGGVIETDPASYEDKEFTGMQWLEHRNFITTNCALWRMERVREGWPVCPRSEGIYSAQVFADPNAVAGYWGSREDGPWIHHIGTERVGTGY